jgi:hypothetical protein
LIGRLFSHDPVISRARPAYVILLVDQSADMAELGAVGSVVTSRAVLAAEAANRALLALIRLSTAPGGAIDHCFDVSVVLHGGPGGVTSGLADTITGARAQGIAAVAAHPLAVERRRRADSAGTATAETIDFPVWVRPAAEGEPRIDEALRAVDDLARRWRRAHPASPSPLIVTLGGGALARAGEGPGASGLMRQARGPALVVNGLFNDEAGGAILCPAGPADLKGDAAATWLFERSSPLPEAARRLATRDGGAVARGARALTRNADPALVLEWILAPRARPRPLAWRWFALSPRPSIASVGEIAWSDGAVAASLADPRDAEVPFDHPRIRRAGDKGFEASWCVLQKAGNRPRDCEDAVAGNVAAGRFCVTDGAGEGVFSRLWARTLAMGWAHGDLGDRDDDTLRAGVKSLDGILRQRIGRDKLRLKDRQSGRLFWFQADERVSEFAAFVGLAFGPGDEWLALAVGDCCLFVEGGGAFRSFPLDAPEQFSGGAYLVPSAIDEDARIMDHVRRLSGRRRPGDRFLLMSDAMACWYLSYPDRRPRLRELLAARDGRALGALIGRERRSRRLRNDDIAILLVQAGPDR